MKQLWWKRIIACLLMTVMVLGPFQMPIPALAALSLPSGNTALINDDFEGVTDTQLTSTDTSAGGLSYKTTVSDVVTIGVSNNNGTFTSDALIINDQSGKNADGTVVNSGSGAGSVTKSFNSLTAGTITVEEDMYFFGQRNDISRGRTPLQIMGGVNNSKNTGDILIQVDLKNSKIQWKDSLGTFYPITTSNISNATWYHLKAVINLDTFKADYTVTKLSDGTKIGELLQQPLYNKTLGANVTDFIVARSFSASTGGSTAENIALDNIQVYKPNAVPDAPAGLGAVAGNTQVALYWSPAKNATTYEVLRSTSDSGPFASLASGITSAATQTSPFNDFNLSNGSTYYYVVRAMNVFGSTDSAPFAVTPSDANPLPQPPAGITADVRDSAIILKWTVSSDASTYTLKRGTSPSGPYSVLSSSLPASQTSYYDTGLASGTTYYYTLSSKNIAGIGPESAQVAVTPSVPLASPANVQAAAVNNQVTLSWDSVASAASYNVKRSSVSGGPYIAIASNLTGLTYMDTTVTNGTNYYYVVSAVSSNQESMNSLEVIAAPYNAPAGAPAASSGVKVIPDDSRVAVSWNAVSGATSYNVKRATAFAGPYTSLGTAAAAKFVDSTAVNGTMYYYAVSAVNASGEGPTAQPASVVPAKVLVVAKDGSGDFTTVQAAINSIPTNNTTRQVIFIRNGYYYEKIIVDRPYISFVGESRDGTFLAYDDYSCKPYAGGTPSTTSFSCTSAGVPIGDPILGTSNSYSMKVTASNFSAENLTILNTAFPRTVVAPAVALYVTGDKAVFHNIRISGYQDTLYVNSGRQYYKNVVIEGDADWIFGNATAVFDNSEIKFDGNRGGYVTAASTEQGSAYGYVFLNSKLTRGTSLLKDYVTKNSWNPDGWDPVWDIDSNITATNGTVDLGRPWQAYANVKYINTWMDAHIKATGWNNWGAPEKELTASYGEYNSSGPGANPKARMSWTKQLTSDEANEYTVQRILKGSDGWDPTIIPVLPTLERAPAAPAAPTGLTATGGIGKVDLIWNAVPGATHYVLKRTTTSGVPYAVVAQVTDTKYSDTGLTNDSIYNYLLSAVNDAGESADTAFVSAKTIAPISIVKADAVSLNTIKVTLNQKLTSFNPADFELNAALGTWQSYSPNLSNTYFTIKNMTTETNEEGNTVVVIETEQPILKDGKINVPPAAENPKKVPYLSAPYYTGDRAKDILRADNLLTWQMDHGGWFKFSTDARYARAWDRVEAKADWKAKDGEDLGTIDNNATTSEILFLSLMYKETGDVRYKEAVAKGIEFLFKAQYASGGWAQVYPVRGNYSDYVTFNDNAMMRVMNVLTMAVKKQYPFNTDIIDDGTRERMQQSLDKGLGYILKSQIAVNGELTAWCAQHDPVTYEPRGARAYEHPSISGSESVEIIKYLMSLPNPSPEVKRAVDSALAWFDANKLAGIKYASADPNNVYFVTDVSSVTWYRFYEIGTGLPIFSGRDGIIKHNILEIEAERRNGYSWGGSYAAKLLAASRTTGYYENRAFVKIAGSLSQTASGTPLVLGDLERIESSHNLDPVTKPDTPAELAAQASNGQVSLTWSEAARAASYSVKRSTSDGGSYETIASGLSGTSYTDANLADGTTYYYVVSAANTAGESGNSAQASVTVDNTPPVTTDNAPAGWVNKDATITLVANDSVSGVAATYYMVNDGSKQTGTTVNVTGDGKHTLTYWSVDKAGNTEKQHTATVNIDKTAPIVAYSGNSVTYSVYQNVYITCTAADQLSGIASSTCQNITGPAYSFSLGKNTYSATATDNAGNTGTGTVSIEVVVTFDALDSLTKQFVSNAEVASGLSAKLQAAKESAARGNHVAKAGQLKAYVNQVTAQSGKALTESQVKILIQLAN